MIQETPPAIHRLFLQYARLALVVTERVEYVFLKVGVFVYSERGCLTQALTDPNRCVDLQVECILA